NLALNMEKNYFKVAVYNRSSEKTTNFINQRAGDKNIKGCYSLEELVETLSCPRKIILMVKAGQPVDMVIESLLPYLDKGDIIIDGGNSHFKDTDRRFKDLQEKGIHFLGTGISGGEYGALHGPSLMPGGEKKVYAQVEDIFTAIAAQTDDGPCVAYLGYSSAGHYVKMVHNGIEYGVMALISEVYDIMRKALGLSPAVMAELFQRWNQSQNSYLLEITAEILEKEDPQTGRSLIDIIQDTAKQKGTGKWSVEEALNLGWPIPTITAAVNSRSLSSFKSKREKISNNLGGWSKLKKEQTEFLDKLKKALYLGTVIAYSEGMSLLEVASSEYKYNLDLAEIARIWEDGCIIRSNLLQPIRSAYLNEDFVHLICADKFQADFAENISALQDVVSEVKTLGLPIPALSSALDYFDTLRSKELPANLIQAQRDYFGAHTYQRRDKDGDFHTEWQDIHNI
ncbi:MAG: NADP-dependent phosphogluconate dehydrogenase, partial [Halarsenatibacteraceae bacterium]